MGDETGKRNRVTMERRGKRRQNATKTKKDCQDVVIVGSQLGSQRQDRRQELNGQLGGATQTLKSKE